MRRYSRKTLATLADVPRLKRNDLALAFFAAPERWTLVVKAKALCSGIGCSQRPVEIGMKVIGIFKAGGKPQ